MFFYNLGDFFLFNIVNEIINLFWFLHIKIPILIRGTIFSELEEDMKHFKSKNEMDSEVA